MWPACWARRAWPQRGAWALLLGLCVVACGEQPLARAEYQLPETWTRRAVPAARSEFKLAVGPSRDGVAATLRVARTRWDGSLLAFQREAERELAEGLPGWRLLSSEPFLTRRGQQGQRIVGELPDGSVTLRLAQHILREGHTIFVLTATRAAGDDPEVDAAFAEAVASFVSVPAGAGARDAEPPVIAADSQARP